MTVSISIASVYLSLLISTVAPQPAYILPQARSDGASIAVPSNSVEYQIVPSSDYAVAAVQPSQSSIMDYVLSPVTAVVSLGSTALSAASWLVFNGSLVFLGMAIVIGFCALTPYCTLTIEKPAFLGRESASTFPYLDELEDYLSQAYNKYQKLQRSAY